MMSKLKILATGILLSVIANQASAQSVVLASNQPLEVKAAVNTTVTAPAKPAAVPALIASISQGHIINAKEMLNDGFDAKVSDANGLTALHYAAQKGYFELVKKLIREGADVNATDNSGKTALDILNETQYKFPREPRVISRLLKAEMDK